MSTNLEYIDSEDYKTLESKLRELKESSDDLSAKQRASRKLRYAEVDVEGERDDGRFQPDEMYVPVHTIDTNIKREQSSYIQYITQSNRAVIVEDSLDPTIDHAILEKDLTKKIRFDGWQLEMFANIDGFQANGFAIMELVQDLNNPGELSYEQVEFADFAFTSDTRKFQSVEMTSRAYYFTRTRLKALCGDKDPIKPENWNWDQVEKLITAATNNTDTSDISTQDASLYKIFKIMFRVNGIVKVAWSCPDTCDNWLRNPRELFIGRVKLGEAPPVAAGAQQPTKEEYAISLIANKQIPQSTQMFETEYPYFIFPYLISENNTIQNLKGRVYLDQDVQEAVTSLLSSACTKARRSSGLYASRDVSDPNADVLEQKNVFLRSGCIVNSKINFEELSGPDPSLFSAINMLQTANQNETSQVNFAVQNRKDSRKTATEIQTANQQNQSLSTVQVVLFSLSLKKLYSTMTAIIQSRVLAGLIKVNPEVLPHYARRLIIKPAGDTDVIEKQQLLGYMMQAWPIVSQSAIAIMFLCDILELMFPNKAQKYITMLQQAQAQQQSQQAQQQAQMMGQVKQMADGIKQLAAKPEMFSETGKIHALPALQVASQQIEQTEKQIGVNQ